MLVCAFTPTSVHQIRNKRNPQIPNRVISSDQWTESPHRRNSPVAHRWRMQQRPQLDLQKVAAKRCQTPAPDDPLGCSSPLNIPITVPINIPITVPITVRITVRRVYGKKETDGSHIKSRFFGLYKRECARGEQSLTSLNFLYTQYWPVRRALLLTCSGKTRNGSTRSMARTE